jgi:hypothetical protein
MYSRFQISVDTYLHRPIRWSRYLVWRIDIVGPLKLFYGNAVAGEQRFPRPDLQAEMLRLLEHSGGLKMFQLRRIGKSTFRVYAEEQMKQRGYTIVSVDAQGLRSPSQLLLTVFSQMPRQNSGFVDRVTRWAASDNLLPDALRKTLGAALSGTVSQDRGASDSIGDYWPTISAQIVHALREEGAKMLLTIDEFTYLLKNLIDDQGDRGRQQADNLLASLREWRAAGLKMVLTGSIGLLSLAREHKFGTEHLNDLSGFPIPPLEKAEARAFIEAAVAGEPGTTWTDAHTDVLITETEVLYPAFLVKGLLTVGIRFPPQPDQIPEIFASRVRPELHDNFVRQLTDRFRRYRNLDREGLYQRDLMLPVLRQIMRAGQNGCAGSALTPPKGFIGIDVQDALAMLHEDGFVAYADARDGERVWRVSSSLVALWWRRAGL